MLATHTSKGTKREHQSNIRHTYISTQTTVSMYIYSLMLKHKLHMLQLMIHKFCVGKNVPPFYIVKG